MTTESFNWEMVGTLIGVISTLVGVPLAAIVFYLRTIRENQKVLQSHFARKVDKVEAECERIGMTLEQVKRRYTTKDEWMRETMLARTQLGRLTELMARLQAELESSRGLATQFVRATHAIIELTERLSRRLAEPPLSNAERPRPMRNATTSEI